MSNDSGWNSHTHGPDEGPGMDCHEKPIGQCVRDAKDAELAALRVKVARVGALVDGWFLDSSLLDSTRRDTCCRDARDDERVEVVEALRAALAEMPTLP